MARLSNRFLFISTVCFTCLFFGWFTASAESIKDMNVAIQVNPDASILVKETFVYDFGDEEKHGMFRTIPLDFKPQGSLESVAIEPVGPVTDENGNPYKVKITPGSAGIFSSPFELKIGDPDKTITGVHTYIFSYLVKNAIGYFDAYDELYWNVTGNDWKIPIEKVEATISLPKESDAKIIQSAEYCGFRGERGSCGGFDMSGLNTLSYNTNNQISLQPGQGVTLAVGFSKGIVVAPTNQDFLLYYFKRYNFLLLCLALALFWHRKRFAELKRLREYRKKHTVIAEYDAGNFSLFETALLYDKRYNRKAVVATVVSLAIHGYLKIENNNGEFFFKKLKEPTTDLRTEEKETLNLVADSSESELTFKNSQNATVIESLFKAVAGRLNTENYFSSIVFRDPTPRFMMIFLTLFLSVNPGLFFIFGFTTFLSGPAMFTVPVTILMIGFFYIFTPVVSSAKLTDKGLDAARLLEGLKLYISVAEKDRMNFANVPAKTPELFEKLLPYAMLFGLEKKWAKEFEGLFKYTPDWCHSTYNTTGSALGLVTGLGFVSTSLDSSFRSVSYSSGGGGSSGGGSSGGGGGGGGGGSW